MTGRLIPQRGDLGQARPSATVPESIDQTAFRRALGQYPTGVAAITAMGSEGPLGMSVGTFTSISLEPALVGFFPRVESGTWARIRETGSFCANVLGAAHETLARQFAGAESDRFTDVGWSAGASGSPILTDALLWVDCVIDDIVRVGDHDLAVGRVLDLGVRDAHGPLLFHQGRYSALSAPAAA